MSFTTTNFDILGRVLLGVIATLIALGIMGFVIYRKKQNKIKLWFKPIGIDASEFSFTKKPLFKTDYKWFLLACVIFIVYWFSTYLVPSLIYLTKFTSVFGGSAANTSGVIFYYDPTLVTTGNTLGGFKLGYINGQDDFLVDNILTSSIVLNPIDSINNWILKQTNVSYYLYYLEFYKIYGALMENGKVDAANHMVDMFYRKVEYTDPSQVFLYGLAELRNIPGFDMKAFNLGMQQNLMLWLHSWVYSNVLLTPLCQAFGLLVPLSIICSYKKDYASFFAPWGFLGGTVTLFGGIVAEDSIHVSAAFIFYDEQIFFLYHFFIFTMGLTWITYNHRYSLKRILYMFVPIICYIIYILIVAHIFNIQYFTTGMTEKDLTVSGSYVIVQQVLANAPLVNGFPSNTALMIFVFVSSLLIIIMIKNLIHYLHNKKHNINTDKHLINDAKSFYNNEIKYFFSKQFYVDKYKKIKAKLVE